jgi:peptidoglycan hydrolase-like protein with peptidoglycan-binding domain
MRLRANRAALVWLVVSGLSTGGASAQTSGGPYFDCSRVKSVLDRALCSNRTATTAGLEYSAARMAYFHSLTESERTNFERIEAGWHADLAQQCSMQFNYLVPYLSAHQVNCVTNLYSGRAQQIKSLLSGDALDEARLSPEERIAIQAALKDGGLLNYYGSDGQYTSSTRLAIRRFQQLKGAPQTGFLSIAQRAALLNKDYSATTPPQSFSQGVTPSPESPIPTAPDIPKTCPKTAAEYPERFDLFRAKIGFVKQSVETWKALRVAAEKAEKDKAGAICVSYLNRIKQAAAEISPNGKSDPTGQLLESFANCIERQISALDKQIDGRARDDPVSMLLLLHGELIRIKIRHRELSGEYSRQRGIMDATKGWFSASIKQCRV